MSNIFRGNTALSKIYRGQTELSKVYRGQTEIWSGVTPPPFSPDDISGLTLWYDFSDTQCYSGTGSDVFDLKKTLDPAHRDGIMYGTYTFDGTNKVMTLGGTASSRLELENLSASYPWTTTREFTIVLWANISAFYGNYSRIMRTGVSTNTNYITLAKYIGTSNYGIYDAAGAGWHNIGVGITTGAWVMYSFVVDSSNNVTVYENSTSKFTYAAGNVAGNYYYLNTGFASSGSTEGYTGDIGAMYVYNAPLNSTQIGQLYTGTNRY